MHGDFDSRNVVLREIDYLDYDKNFPLMLSVIKEAFASKLVLFVGFSFTDPNLQAILESVERVLTKDVQPPYLLINKSNEKGRADLISKGIKILEYDSATDDYFAQIKTDEDSKALDALSDKGEEIYKLLRVIEEFDLTSDTLENLNTQNQLIYSINRFKELGAIPLEVIETTTPFKLKGRPINDLSANARYDYYNPFHLEILNEDLLSLLKSRKNGEGKIDFLAYRDKKLKQEEQQLNQVLRLLYMSGVQCIIRKNDTKTTHYKLIPVNKGEKCVCMRCLNDRFEIKEMLKQLNTHTDKSLCKDSVVELGLSEAYGYLKSGQLVKCFYMLEDVKVRAMRTHNIITSFLALYNQKALLPLIGGYYEFNRDESEVEEIVSTLRKIDLNKFLIGLKVDQDIYRCLSYIMENRILEDTLNSIDSDFYDVMEIYEKYKRSGYHTNGPNYWHRINSSFYLLYYFYHQNFLFGDETNTYYRVVVRYIEAMIASYATSERFPQRLTKFPDLFFLAVVNYSNPNEIIRLLTKYRVTNFGYEDDARSIVNNFVQFLDTYQKNRFLADEIKKDNLFSFAMDNYSYFRSRFLRTFNNFLVVLKYWKLNATQYNEILDKVINSLSVNDHFGENGALKHFLSFLNEHILLITDANVLKTIRFILSDNIWSDKLIGPFCGALISKRKSSDILDKRTYDEIIRRTLDRRIWPVRLGQAIPFYALFKVSEKKKFENYVTKYIEESPSRTWDILKTAYHWRMWTPENKEDLFNAYFDHVVLTADKFPDYSIEADGMVDGDFYNEWNDAYFTVSLIYTFEMFDRSFVHELHSKYSLDILKWILRPSEFDYSLFKLQWLLVFSDEGILSKLKAISQLHLTVQELLKKDFNQKVSELYFSKLV